MPLRFVLSFALLPACTVASAQSPDAHGLRSEAQESFELLKSLSANWQGPVTTNHPAWSTDEPLNISVFVASRGNVLVHELNQSGTPELTLFYVEDDRLELVHYCDYATRSYLVARPSREANAIEFDLVEYSGENQIGHISHAVFTIVDHGQHIEDWTFTLADGTAVDVHMDLRRVP